MTQISFFFFFFPLSIYTVFYMTRNLYLQKGPRYFLLLCIAKDTKQAYIYIDDLQQSK